MKKKRSNPRGSVILEWRGRRGLSQKQLAEMTGLHVSSVGAYERGERNPNPEKLARICLALDVEPETFCGEVAQAEAGELRPLIDELKKDKGVEVSEQPGAAPHLAEMEELGRAWNVLSDYWKGIFLSARHLSQDLPELSQRIKTLLQLMQRLPPRPQD